MIRLLVYVVAALGLATGCQTTLPVPHLNGPEPVYTGDQIPPGADPGTCWGKDVTPAVVETVTEQIIVQPAVMNADGTIRQPAIYRTERRQEIIREREELWFETPCPDLLTPDFIASLQRALQARGIYRGAVTGEMDTRTRQAVRQYQRPQGLDSGTLSLSAARSLGLVALERDDALN